ncbi:(S)-mandelate dehydrogenase, mitochondrial [Saitozyma sp. JCM 24511]|nr:(S)-mandelate dehydrogenase, mitochondrial [Saitozyma sp. JCM 24511]
MTLGTAVGRAPSVAWRQLPRPTVSVIGHTKARAASAASAALLLPGRGQNRRLATGAGSATGYTAREGKLVAAAALVLSGGVAWAASRPVVRLEDEAATQDRGRDRDEKLPLISAREIRKHNAEGDCWIVIQGNVYDVTDFPGGPGLILQFGGKDATEAYTPIHPKGTIERTLPPSSLIGTVDTAHSYLLADYAIDPNEDEAVRAERRKALPPVAHVENLKQFEQLAEAVLGKTGRSMIFYRSVAEDGVAFAKNLSSFSYLQFRPRVLVPVEHIDPTAEMLPGLPRSPLPIFISPAARAGVGHPDGERTLTRGAAATGITQCISSAASLSLDEIFDEKRTLDASGQGDARTWFQLYAAKDPKVTQAKVQEALAGGCTAILLTVDLPVLGKRENDPASHAGLIGREPWVRPYDADMTFEVIPWLKSIAPGIPIVIKGVATPEDAELAYKAGAAGVLLSNHGGRQLDYAPPPLATLVRIRQTKPELLDRSDFSVLMDCGVRRGSDVLKALCLGAKGVGLGRPFLYAQTCYGEQGVVRAIQILEEEIQIGMRLLGAKSIADLKPSMVELLDGLVGRDL